MTEELLSAVTPDKAFAVAAAKVLKLRRFQHIYSSAIVQCYYFPIFPV